MSNNQVVDKAMFDSLELDAGQIRELIKQKVTKEVAETIDLMKHPVELQKELAAKIKHILDDMMDKEKSSFDGQVSDDTLKLIKEYHYLLDSIHKNLYGTKSVNMDVKVTHSQIATMIRKHTKKGDLKSVDAEFREVKRATD